MMRGNLRLAHPDVTHARDDSLGPPLSAALWFAYLFALPFHRVWALPWFGTKLQPPELVLVALAAVAAVRWLRGAVRWQPVAIDAAAAAWLIACVISVVTAQGHLRFSDPTALAEALGGVSLVGLYAAVRLTAAAGRIGRVGTWIGMSAAIAALLGIAGVILARSGVQTQMATLVMTLVPVLGNAPRAQAFTAGPQMLASILLLAAPLYAASRLDRVWRPRDTAVLALLIAGLAATLSKTALCVVPALAVMWAVGPVRPSAPPRHGARRRRAIAAAVWVAAAIAFAAGSHVMLVRDAELARWRAGQVVAGEPAASIEWRGERWHAIATTYVYNKRASLLAIAEQWPRGIGPAQQPDFTARLQRDGRMPASMAAPYTTPHSTYLGPVAELGAPGLVALALLLITSAAAIRRLIGASGLPGWEAAAYAGAGSAFLIEAISTDLMNCRHYWWLLAIVAARAASLPRRVRAPG